MCFSDRNFLYCETGRLVISDNSANMAMFCSFAYGLPVQDSKVSITTPYLYSCKEFYSLKGINLYDFHARTYAPDLCRFLQPDPKADHYHWLSPYFFCNGDPINNIDPTGENIAVLLARDGFTHLAMMIQDEEGVWKYFSVNGTNIYVSGNFSGGKKWNETDVDINNNSPQEFLDSDFNKEIEDGGEKFKNVTNYN